MTELKLCGMRSAEDLDTCRKADYLGFVVLSDSPRCLEIERARELMSVCERPRVAVTTETRPQALAGILRSLEPDVLQLHSPLDPGLLSIMADHGVPIWGMLTVRPGAAVDRLALPYLQALLLDSPGPRAGGNGQVHDWTLSLALRKEVEPLPVVLAGGLNAENVRQAVEAVRPSAVDISTGAEERGRKDPRRVMMIMDALRGMRK
jgi:phosphoribosylanthranilate isomerase